LRITPTHINYFQLCHRKLWLFHHNIQMEHTSDTVYEGKLIGETSYPQRAGKFTELVLEGAKIDFYDTKNKVVHEVKKSNKMEAAHIAQVKYYLYRLEQLGIEGASGILEYPKLRKTREVILDEADKLEILQWELGIEKIVSDHQVPERIQKSKCRRCSYYDFCWSEE